VNILLLIILIYFFNIIKLSEYFTKYKTKILTFIGKRIFKQRKEYVFIKKILNNKYTKYVGEVFFLL